MGSWDGRWSNTRHGELGETGSHIGAFTGDTSPCQAPRGSNLQPGTAASCLGRVWAELCRCRGRGVNAWQPLSRLISIKWTGDTCPRVREGRWRPPRTSAIPVSMRKDCDSCFCSARAAYSREGGWETGACRSDCWMETCRRLSRKEEAPLYPLDGQSSSLSGLEGCGLQSVFGVIPHTG